MTSKSSPQGFDLYRINNGTYKLYRKYSWIDFANGDDNPNWRTDIKERRQAANNFSAYKAFVDFRPMYYESGWETFDSFGRITPQTPGIHSGWLMDFIPSIPDPSHNSSALAQALGRFNSKVSEYISPVKGGVFLGELRETYKLLKSPVHALFTDVMDYKRKAARFARVMRQEPGKAGRFATKKLSELWLEKAFGWAPLAMDIEAAASMLLVPRARSILIKGKGKVETASTAERLTNSPVQTLDLFLGHIKTVTKSEAQILGVIENRAIPPDLPKPASAEDFGLTLREFVPTAWELLPYSFLVDYFVNVGDIINSVFLDRRNVIWSVQTRRSTAFENWSMQQIGPFVRFGNTRARRPRRFSPGSLRMGAKRFDRTKDPVLIPPVDFTYPSFGSLRWANMAALIGAKINVR